MKTLTQKVLDLVGADTPAEEIEKASRALFDVFRVRKHVIDAQAIVAFKVGQKVRVSKGSRRVPLGTIGVIERLGSRNLSVDFGVFLKWRISPSMVEPAPETAEIEA